MSAFLALLAAGAAFPADTPNWQYRNLHDKMTELDGGAAIVKADGQTAIFGLACEVATAGRPLSFRYVLPGNKLVSSLGSIVQIRVDRRPLFEDKWYARDHRVAAIHADQVAKLILELDGAKEMMIRAHDIDGQPVDATFNVEGASTAIRWVLDACGK